MALRARYLADTSALGRLPHPAVERRLRPLLEENAIATCAIVDLEALLSARNLPTTNPSWTSAEVSTR